MEKKDKNGLTESEFLAAYNPGNYERPSVTVDIMVFRMKQDLSGLQVLLIKRGGHPYLDCLALPGGFIEMNESGYEAAQRELKEETGISGIYMEQSYTMTKPDRDPRMRVIDIAYTALLPYGTELEPKAGDDASSAEWYDVFFDGHSCMKFTRDNSTLTYNLQKKVFKNGDLTIVNYVPVWSNGDKLAFDHAEILLETLMRLKNKVEYTDIAFNLVPKEFTIPMVKKVYEILTCKTKNYTQISRLIKEKIENTGKKQKSTDRPPTSLYRYKKQEV